MPSKEKQKIKQWETEKQRNIGSLLFEEQQFQKEKY